MRAIWIIAVTSFFLACGSDSGAGGDGKGKGSACADTAECAEPLVCSAEGTCDDAASCGGHSDCTNGSHCGASGVCEGNVSGGSCATNQNCIGSEVCDVDTCVMPGPNGCVPPDLMIVLDRTGSMAERPDGTLPDNSPTGIMQTKWYFAVTSIEAVVLNLQGGIRFGLAMFPRDADDFDGEGDCSNLSTWLEEFTPPETNNEVCEQSDLEVSPKLNAEPEISAALSVEEGGLCLRTPIGSGLEAARSELAQNAASERQQFVLLITDGADNCDGESGYATDSLDTAKALAEAEVLTYVVGFDGSGSGIDENQLNDLACAGKTAPNFMDNCEDDGSGGFEAQSDGDRVDDQLFLLAEDAAGLQQALEGIGSEICCGNCGSVD